MSIDYRWPRVRSLEQAAGVAAYPSIHARDPYLCQQAEIREEFVQTPQASFIHVGPYEYKIRVSWHTASDAMGGLTWTVPKSVASGVHAVYVVWMNDIIDHLRPVEEEEDTSAASAGKVLSYTRYTSQEFPVGRPFITTPFFPPRRKTGRSTSPSASKDEYFYMVVQFIPEMFSYHEKEWAPDRLTAESTITAYIIQGLYIEKWINDALERQQTVLQQCYGCADISIPSGMYGKHEKKQYEVLLYDEWIRPHRSEYATSCSSSSLHRFSTALCPRQKHYLVWPLFSLSIPSSSSTSSLSASTSAASTENASVGTPGLAHLCCERNQHTPSGLKWTKCPYRSTPSFLLSRRLATISRDGRTRAQDENKTKL
jgi:hypothetical protein